MGAFRNRDIISIKDFSREELLHILDNAKLVEENYAKYQDALKGYILAVLFFEPSTRTRLSFESAMHRLGGSVIGFSNPSATSISKGETMHDTIRIVEGYSDVIVMRHPKEGAAKVAAHVAEKVPVINAGDGANEHPTQTMTDLYTIRKEFGKLEGLRIGFVGDLKYGRTVHSLTIGLSHFNPKIYYISPKALQVPDEYKQFLKEKNVSYKETTSLEEYGKELDVLYVTRVQKERFLQPEDYDKVKGIYKLDLPSLQKFKPNVKILHPLPRVDEVNPRLDSAKQSIYFRQAHNGVPVRMALLAMVLGKMD